MGFIKNTLQAFGICMAKTGIQIACEEMRNELHGWEKRGIPLTYHNIDVLFERFGNKWE